MDRVEEIIEQFDPDEISLDEGSEIYEEGQELLAEIRNCSTKMKVRSLKSND